MPSLLNTVRDLDRLRQIVAVLTRHGFGEIVQRTGLGSLLPGGHRNEETVHIGVGERIRLVVQDLGPSFVKLGQIVSTRPDLVPEDIITQLKVLQDSVPPVPFAELEPHVEAELGAPIAEIFESFDPTPLASASIGQVHRARLRTEEGPVEVVVKIQRPNIKKTIERDLDLLYALARAVERSIPESRIYSPAQLVGEFDRAIHAELDFLLEADHAERFADNFLGVDYVKFPTVYRSASSRRVLTLEYLPGKKIYDAVEGGASGETLAKNAIKVIVKQIFEDGFFHADPHPGNVLILGPPEAPVIGMIDLGLVGRLTPRLRDRTIDLMVAAARRDYSGIADSLYAIGKPTKKIDRQAYEAEVAVLADRYLGKRLQDIELSALIRDLIYGATKYGIEVPSDFMMVGKALMTVEGVGKEIYPELDVFEEVQPYFLELLRIRYSPEKVSQDVLRSVIRLSGAASEMPLQLQEILDDLRHGALKLRIQDESLVHAAEGLGRRVYSGMVVGALWLSCAILIAAEHEIVGAIAFVMGLFLASSHLVLLWFLKRSERKRQLRG